MTLLSVRLGGSGRARLEEERLFFSLTRGTATTPVVLRSATIYGRGILMVEAALAVWPVGGANLPGGCGGSGGGADEPSV